MSTTHVLQHKLLDVAHQLLVHRLTHRVVADGVAVVVLLMDEGAFVLLLGRCILNGLLLLVSLLVFCWLSVAASFFLMLGLQIVKVFINHCGCGHTGVAAFNHTCLTALNDVLIHLDRTETHQLVEAHHSLLNVEWLSQIVVGSQRNVLIGHILLGQHTVGHQHELRLGATVVHLELRTKLATRHWCHVLLTDDEVGIQRLNVRQRFLDVVVGVEVVDVAQMGIHEVQELPVVVYQYDGKLLGL